MRSKFDRQLAELNESLMQMGSWCEEAISLTANSLLTGDVEMAGKVSEIETEIDHAEREIESLCLRLLLHQQPVAKDLRQVSAALKMITDMERIGDQALDIAEIIPFVTEQNWHDSTLIGEMARETIKMVTDSVNAYVKQDLSLAAAVSAHDDVVDDYFTRIKQSLIARIVEKQEEAELALDLLMIAKYFERIGDHAVNISEWVVFSVTGEHKQMEKIKK